MMENMLHGFVDPNMDLRKASLNLLDSVVGNNCYTPGPEHLRVIRDLCKRRGVNCPKVIDEVLDNINSCYYVARLDQRAFSKDKASEVEWESALDESCNDKYKGLLFYAVDVNEGVKLQRTVVAELTRVFNRLAKNPIVLLIRQGTFLSIATCERKDFVKQGKSGEKMGKVNILRDINCSKPVAGHLQILEKLKVDRRINTFEAIYKHWFEVFNTKTLTEQFYKDLYNWFLWVVNDPNTHFPDNKELPKHENEDKSVKIIRLITRLLFVWFIKEKKVKTEDNKDPLGLVPEILFDKERLVDVLDYDPDSNTQSEYYNAILQNLFFATLNNEIGSRRFVDTSNRYRSSKGYTVKNLFRDNKGEGKSWFKISHDEVLDLFKTVPFLNCGLFECLDKYARADISYDVDRIFDGFSTKSGDKFRACLPNCLFFADSLPEVTIQVTEDGKKKPLKVKSKGLINILNEYVFTIEENTPLDQQVSLDPELLGKVFENLLAAYNPETQESARKSSGSYYTPREIVEYMVNESLIQHLKTSLNADDNVEKELRHLVSPNEEEFKLDENQQNSILDALYRCRILDPACGSGAFPMGMLQQMVHIIRRLDEHNEKWERLVTEKAKQETAKAFENKELTDEERKKVIEEITNTFNISKNNPDYTRKLYLIQNCIFGVDIQPIAMMISKLRFFISLICEQDDQVIDFRDVEHNYGINTLPNLETKFVAANSLLTPDVKAFSGDWTNDEKLDKLKDELMELRYRHVTTRTLKDKLKIRTLDDEKRDEINKYILSTRAHADQAKIALLQDQIIHLTHERQLYKGENIVEEYVEVQASLFDEPQKQLSRKDLNKIKRDEIDRQIHTCQAEIAREQAKENIGGFEAAVKQLTEWNPYDQVKSSPFFDPDWMFGVIGGFDIVIGNPPYVSNIAQEDKRIYLSVYGDIAQGQLDLYSVFSFLAIKLSKKDGVNSFIIPDSVIGRSNFEALRKELFKLTIKKWVHINKVFENANVSSLIYVLSNTSNVQEKSFEYIKSKDVDLWIMGQYEQKTIFYSNINKTKYSRVFFVSKEEFDVVSRFLSATERLDGGDFISWRGEEMGKKSNLIQEKKESTSLPIIVGEDVHRYESLNTNKWIDVSNVKKKGYNNVKIVIRQLGDQINATIDTQKHIDIQSVYNICLSSLSNEQDLSILLGILNSHFSDFIYRVLTSDKFEYQRIILDNIREIPVAQNWKKANLIGELAKKVIVNKDKKQADTITLEMQIDILVYLIYGLTHKEIMVIENILPQDSRLNMEEFTYTKWLERYQKNGCLPSEEEMEAL